ncbi:phenylacetate--CoA ligase [Pseudoclavibacter chungangensis]|uniref:Phenylacetate-coenzyme A ligase n=1 Tax=Pseudoclavibacter chungangensis TaxID=587635 RepID=A0A7J5BZY4_9MICO|nr:phenylacetate--CoA ligase PaaK [Pseudoclavibacter chungangensis]KAB1660217.1 phenylacetate--CoA ligase [Pseudoclavibacter chungangensis]
MSRDELEALQLERLRWTLRHAYENVPFCRRRFDEHGVHPDDLVELADLRKFPYTTKDDLRENYPFGMFAVPMDRVPRIHASSGTTGLPTVVGYTRGDLDNWATVVARSFRISGTRPGDLVQNAYGYGLFTGGLGAHAGIEKLGCTVVPMSGGQTDKQIQLIEDFRPRVICCTPTYLLTILDAMRHRGIDPRATSLEVAVLGAEPWTNEMRREIEAGFDLRASDIYGLSEVMGPGVAGESAEYQDGSTIWEDHFLPEIVDPDDLTRVLDDGETGELVFTSLTKEALPIIRYRTKDLSQLLPGTARPAMRRMAKIKSRTDDMIILRGVNLFPSQIEEIALAIPGLSPHYHLELTRPGRMDELTVVIERREDCTPEAAAAASEELRRCVKIRIGSTVNVTVAEPMTLERSAGKLKRLHDLRGPVDHAG